MSLAPPTAWINGCTNAHAALLADLDGLTDSQARQPSRLPDWSVGHLLTHIARNADSVVRRLEGAKRGEVLTQYAGGIEGRWADIAAGADRSAAELVADVRASATAVDQLITGLPPALWDAHSITSRGVEEDARAVVFSRWREVAVHHGDLGLTEVPVPLPPELVSDWLPMELVNLPGRGDPQALLTWIIGRGPAPDLEPW
ncbi:MAG TPA: maleylpyruvate isomerase N-terminal domain-containing protein [Acidimicrobiales bacterium]|jgi:maleylpyruvate isomerase